MLWIDIQAKNELNRLLHAERKKYPVYTLNDFQRVYRKNRFLEIYGYWLAKIPGFGKRGE